SALSLPGLLRFTRLTMDIFRTVTWRIISSPWMIAVLLIVAWVPQFIATFLIRASGVGGILWTSGVCDGVAGHYPCVLGFSSRLSGFASDLFYSASTGISGACLVNLIRCGNRSHAS